jgi:hypothetical protein
MAAQLVASQVVLSSTELVSYLVNSYKSLCLSSKLRFELQFNSYDGFDISVFIKHQQTGVKVRMNPV